MGVNLETIPNSDNYRKNIFEIGEEIVYRIHRPWLYDDFMYRLLGGFARLNRFLKPAHEFINSVIDRRRASFKELPAEKLVEAQENVYLHKKQRYALLDMLLAAQANNQIDNAGIEEEVNTFTFEGYDTSSTAMTFILLLIGTHQDVQQKILKEIEEMNEQVQKEGGGEWEPNHYNSLGYMNRVIKESLRLYPPVCYISRTLTEDLVLGMKIEGFQDFCKSWQFF
jgi:cytochrome P450 family 4